MLLESMVREGTLTTVAVWHGGWMSSTNARRSSKTLPKSGGPGTLASETVLVAANIELQLAL